MIDQTTAEGKALQAIVGLELRNYLGKDYKDDVLPLYIVVMLAHGNEQPLVAENLEAFLGEEKAVAFADWLFKHLAANPGKYDAPSSTVPEMLSEQPAIESKEAVVEGNDHSTGKRRGEKREKIEWRGEEPAKLARHRDRDDRREEKRRRSDDLEARSGRHERSNRDRERSRDWDRIEREREHAGTRRGQETYRSRYELPEYEEARHAERGERYRKHRERDSDGHARRSDEAHDRKEKRHRHREEKERERPSRTSRLAGRLGDGHAQDSTLEEANLDNRHELRPSVFDRLEKGDRGAALDGKGKMRMDALSAAKPDVIEDFEEEFEPEEMAGPKLLAPTSSLGQHDEVASELRQIRETLAKMQAEKARQINTVVASANARRVVVHNVHFNATPDILKAHFGGCGAIVSSIIERDPIGNPKGTAVIEFEEESSRRTALSLSGSMLLGRPVTVHAKEAAPPPGASFQPRAPAFRGRGMGPGRGLGRPPSRGRGPPAAGRPMLKNNKYVRPQSAANGGS